MVSQQQTILITRPGENGLTLVKQLKDKHISAYYLPLIKIEPCSVEPLFVKNIDKVIFISPNAVTYGLKQLTGLKHSQIGVVGKGTLQALTKQGFDVQICPEREFSSEGLLQHPLLKKLKNNSILIVRGVGGREKLKTELEHRGAEVNYLEVYKRQEIQYSATELELIRNKSIKYIQISNQQTLEIIYNLFKENKLLNDQLIWWFLSQRTINRATELGIKKQNCILIKPGNQALLEMTTALWLNTSMKTVKTTL